MTAEEQDITLYEEESKVINPSPLIDGNDNSVDLTNADLEWIVVDGVGNEIISKTDGNGINITSATNGEWEIVVNPSDTDGEGGDYYKHEARLIDETGDESVIATGDFQIKQSYTDD